MSADLRILPVEEDRRPRGRPPVEVLWCPNRKNAQPRAGWSFPEVVEAKIRELCGDGSVLHLFGGQVRFGTRLDIDPATNPDVIGDAWLAAHLFRARSFDTAVLDPPYYQLAREELQQLMAAAGIVARRQVIWLHQIWAPSQLGLSLERAWLVRCGDNTVVRTLQLFRRNAREVQPLTHFSRGRAMKYNRWLRNDPVLPFSTSTSESTPSMNPSGSKLLP